MGRRRLTHPKQVIDEVVQVLNLVKQVADAVLLTRSAQVERAVGNGNHRNYGQQEVTHGASSGLPPRGGVGRLFAGALGGLRAQRKQRNLVGIRSLTVQ